MLIGVGGAVQELIVINNNGLIFHKILSLNADLQFSVKRSANVQRPDIWWQQWDLQYGVDDKP